jgi:hypothetical protein
LVALALVSCAAPSEPRPDNVVALLADEPARPYKEIARLEVRGNPGEHVRYVYDELRKGRRPRRRRGG